MASFTLALVTVALCIMNIYAWKNHDQASAAQLEAKLRSLHAGRSFEASIIARNSVPQRKSTEDKVAHDFAGKMVEEYSISKYPELLDEEHVGVYKQIEEAQNIDELFQCVDEVKNLFFSISFCPVL
jgi:hypothetical protein